LANAIKAVLIGLASFGSLVVFARDGDLDWGAALALGPQAKQWIYRLLILAPSAEVLLMLVRWLVRG
jgi:hypothetical protein